MRDDRRSLYDNGRFKSLLIASAFPDENVAVCHLTVVCNGSGRPGAAGRSEGRSQDGTYGFLLLKTFPYSFPQKCKLSQNRYSLSPLGLLVGFFTVPPAIQRSLLQGFTPRALLRLTPKLFRLGRANKQLWRYCVPRSPRALTATTQLWKPGPRGYGEILWTASLRCDQHNAFLVRSGF